VWLSPRDSAARPRAKVRRRYVRAIVHCQGSRPTKEELIQVIRTSICEAFGLKGLAEVSPRLVFYDELNGVAIVRCAHPNVHELCAALALINHVGGRILSVNPETVSGLMGRLRIKSLN